MDAQERSEGRIDENLREEKMKKKKIKEEDKETGKKHNFLLVLGVTTQRSPYLNQLLLKTGFV